MLNTEIQKLICNDLCSVLVFCWFLPVPSAIIKITSVFPLIVGSLFQASVSIGHENPPSPLCTPWGCWESPSPPAGCYAGRLSFLPFNTAGWEVGRSWQENIICLWSRWTKSLHLTSTLLIFKTRAGFLALGENGLQAVSTASLFLCHKRKKTWKLNKNTEMWLKQTKKRRNPLIFPFYAEKPVYNQR